MPTHAILKPMTVEGTTITVEQQTQAINYLRSFGAFKFSSAIFSLAQEKVPYGISDRVADRLIQRLRKQGLIAFGKEIPGYWTWVS